MNHSLARIAYCCIHINNLLEPDTRGKQEAADSAVFEGQSLFARIIAAGIGKDFLCKTLCFNGCLPFRFLRFPQQIFFVFFSFL